MVLGGFVFDPQPSDKASAVSSKLLQEPPNGSARLRARRHSSGKWEETVTVQPIKGTPTCWVSCYIKLCVFGFPKHLGIRGEALSVASNHNSSRKGRLQRSAMKTCCGPEKEYDLGSKDLVFGCFFFFLCVFCLMILYKEFYMVFHRFVCCFSANPKVD